MGDDLMAQLRSNARSLDGLLALTPAKNMFGEDVSDQWKRKKQTPEQKRAAKLAKLDPNNWKSAKDVYDEMDAAAKKRKRSEHHDDVPEAALSPEASKLPQDADPRQQKKRKVEAKNASAAQANGGNAEADAEPKLSKAAAKRARQKERKQKDLEKKERQKARKAAEKQAQAGNHSSKNLQQVGSKLKDDDSVSEDDDKEMAEAIEIDKIPVGDLSDVEMDDDASTVSSESEVSEVLSPPQESASSSVSSIPHNISESLPNSLQKDSITQPTHPNPEAALQTDQEKSAARERLQKQILQFRSQRKADNRPARSRAELLDQRRRKEEERKAAKKEQRRREKEEEAKRQDEEIAKRFSPGGSGSLLASPRSPIVDSGPSINNKDFNFGRIAFDDGTQLDPNTLAVLENKKHKGPADTATALKAAQSKASRLSGLDEQKRKEIEEKDMWLNAKKRAHGERVRDDTSLLKKALRRQESQKKKSEKEWDNRIEGVKMAQEAKQRKRMENLQKRKDEKNGVKGSKGKKVKRPGFEGSFKGRTGGGKKK